MSMLISMSKLVRPICFHSWNHLIAHKAKLFVNMEVEIITLPSSPWPPLQTDPNSQKHSTENHLPKHVAKASFTNESKVKGQNTFPDTRFKRKLPKITKIGLLMTMIRSTMHKDENW